MRRRYSDFEWLKNELERDSKVRPGSDLLVPETRTYGNSCSHNLELPRREAVVVGSCWGLISVHIMGLEGGVSNGKGYPLAGGCSADRVILCFQIVVPPLPGKALKRQLPFRGDEGIFEESFIEERRQGLEQFINK